MSYTLERLDDGHIIVMTLGSDFDLDQEMIESSNECFAMVEEGPDRIVFISDGRELHINNLNDVIVGANTARRPETRRVSEHPKIIKNLTVSNSKVINLAMKGMNSASFGFFEVTIFETLEEALNYARKLLYGQAQAN